LLLLLALLLVWLLLLLLLQYKPCASLGRRGCYLGHC